MDIIVKSVFFVFYSFLIWSLLRIDMNHIKKWKKIVTLVLGFPILVVLLLILKLTVKNEKIIDQIWSMGFLLYIIYLILTIFHFIIVNRAKNMSKDLDKTSNILFKIIKAVFSVFVFVLITCVFFFIRQ